MFMDTREPVAPTEYLISGVIEFLSSLSPRDFAALIAQARPPVPPDPEGNSGKVAA